MSEHTAIEWTDATWSPWEGCTKVSPGCDHCYAEGMNRWLRNGANWGPGAPRREYSEAHWRKPPAWNAKAQREGRRIKVFPSVCDPFDNEVPDAWRHRFFRLILDTPHLTWLLLTKRIGNVAKALEADQWEHLGNVWLGATVIDQAEADRDIPKLLAAPARVRFLSIEPMLGPIDLVPYIHCDVGNAIDWIIAGGESGAHARPAHPNWFRSLRDQCAAGGVPFHFKQWGEWLPVGQQPVGDAERWSKNYFDERGIDARNYGKTLAGRLLDGVEHNGFPAP
jgi:protein gp37